MSGKIRVFFMRLSLMRISNMRTQSLTYVAIEGKDYFCRLSPIIFEMPGCLAAVLCNDCNKTLSNCSDKGICK